tara:strand:+ start:7583 stop:7756 length:174 start_codon:yes stop_codon:yes gene_type:complete
MEVSTYDLILEQIELFVDNHAKAEAGNKSAGTRARKAIGKVKKLATSYRKQSVADSK